jgi:hypothetical protein
MWWPIPKDWLTAISRIKEKPLAQRCYRKLQQHLNRMPVGYPRTISGVEIRILKRLFTPREAEIALLMDHRLETVDAIHQRGAGNGIGRAQVRSALEAMARKGAVLNVCREGEEHFALVPFVVGMFEFQCGSLSQEMYRDTVNYLKQGFALEYLSTALPQTRVIPIRRSLANVHAVATYDEIRALVERAGGRVGLAPCICRQGKDLVGQPCDRTDRREVCLVLRDLFEHGQRYGLAKALSTREALDILRAMRKKVSYCSPPTSRSPSLSAPAASVVAVCWVFSTPCRRRLISWPATTGPTSMTPVVAAAASVSSAAR